MAVCGTCGGATHYCLHPDEAPVFATDTQAKAAFKQFTKEPHPSGAVETYPDWNNLSEGNRQLWYRVATAVLNAKPVDEL